MDVFYRTTGGQLAEDFWNSTSGWQNQTLPGSADAASGPSAIHRSSSSMDVFYRTTGRRLAEDFWNSTSGWANKIL